MSLLSEYRDRLYINIGKIYLRLWFDWLLYGVDNHTAWESAFAFTIQQLMHLRDLEEAECIRRQAGYSPLIVPAQAAHDLAYVLRYSDPRHDLTPDMELKLRRPQTEAVESIVAATSWAPEHVETMNPFVAERAKLVMDVEREFLRRKHAILSRGFNAPEPRVPLYRLEAMRRNALGEIAETSMQVELSHPMLSDAFPFARYDTRCDGRVRPTHKRMEGMLALRSWEFWPIVRPKNGFSCRCSLRLIAQHEAIRHGWMTRNGYAKFEVRWPNNAARLNFEARRFPDAGWFGPKFWSFPARAFPVVRVA